MNVSVSVCLCVCVREGQRIILLRLVFRKFLEFRLFVVVFGVIVVVVIVVATVVAVIVIRCCLLVNLIYLYGQYLAIDLQR